MSADAEKVAIESMIGEWMVATNKGGEEAANAYATFVTEDAVFLPPNAPRAEGRDAVRELIKGFTMADDFSIKWGTSRIDVTADEKQAFGYGYFEYSLKDEAGNQVTEEGSWMDVFEKQGDGSWLCSMAMFNSDIPVDGS